METVQVPFLDLKAQLRSIREEIDGAIAHVLETTQFVLGEEVARFEEEFAHYTGARFGIGVNSGTSALHLSLLALGVGPGDEVITVPNTFVATVAAIRYTGARVVYVDVDPDTLLLDPAQLERAITPRTKAVIPVHLYGQMAQMDPILAIARAHGVAVVEDACQAHGARQHGRPAGSLGELGCFSFYPGKNLGAYGEGGMVVTSDEGLAAKIRMLRDWGQDRKYNHVLEGFNNRLEGIQGAVLRVKLRHLERWIEARRAHAAHYRSLLAGGPFAMQAVQEENRHVYHVFAVRTREREGVMKALAEQGIQTGIHYPIPCHLQPAYRDDAWPQGSMPHAERAAAEVMSLPMFPELEPAQVETVVAALREVARAW